MVWSQVGYCPCGREIWIEYLHGDGRWSHRFFLDDHQEATHCPDCGREINEDELESL